MKQSKELNKAIENAIKAAHAEREEMEKQRDIWERAIQEKDRQIDTLNGMLTPQKLAASVEVEEEKEKPFNEVWGEFAMTLNEGILRDENIINQGRKWCEMFYNYEIINTEEILCARYSEVESRTFVPFLRFMQIDELRVDNEIKSVSLGNFLYNNNDNTQIIGAWIPYRTIQRS